MNREEKMALAGEYVLGLLDDDARESIDAARGTDPELDALIQRASDAFAGLDASAEAAPLSEGLWGRIEAGLDQPDAAPAQPTATVIPLAQPSRRRPTSNRWLPIAAAVLLSLGVGYLAGDVLRGEPEPVVIAILTDEAAQPGAVVEAYGDDSVRMRLLHPYAVPDGQVMQVWTLPDAQTGPVSLGTLPSRSSAHLQGPELPRPAAEQLYEITLETAPGSPTGRPTGPILAKGFAKVVR